MYFDCEMPQFWKALNKVSRYKSVIHMGQMLFVSIIVQRE